MMLTSRVLGAAADATAPDGSEVRLLVTAARGSMAHFTLGPGQVSRAVAHRSVEEVWFFIHGLGRMWRSLGDDESILEVKAGLSINIPPGTSFQFRCDSAGPLQAVGVTMPPWPGMDEAYEVKGLWPGGG